MGEMLTADEYEQVEDEDEQILAQVAQRVQDTPQTDKNVFNPNKFLWQRFMSTGYPGDNG